MEYIDPFYGNSTWEAAGLPFGSVSWLVPNSDRFSAFTRLFHPISGDAAGSHRWRDLALSHGLAWHSEIQFGNLVAADPSYQAPFGNLGQEPIRRIMHHVVEEAGEDVACVAALCDIDTWTSPMSHDAHSEGRVGVSAESMNRAGHLTGPPPSPRVYTLFQIRASDVARFGLNIPGVMFVQMQPTLVIAVDGSFCLATDPDYDSTILASGGALQGRILRDEGVESIAIDRKASLLHDADHING